jgi:pyruvate dehydrogenase E2 component (dihydrolipoamide acetyltransferase)
MEFRMPSLGADMEAGTLVAWHRAVGESIARGEILAEVDTDKGVIEIESFVTGRIEALLVEPGTRVPVGTVLAIIQTAEEPAVEAPPAPKRHPVSPLARKRAEELGIDPEQLVGSGPGGRVTREDVERAAPPAQAPPAQSPPQVPEVQPTPAEPRERSRRMRQAIAAAMARSKREIPHYYLSTTIDLQAALDWLAAQNAQRPVTERLLPAALLLKATACALKRFPDLNAFWEEGTLRPQPSINVGVAISLREGGLVAPALLAANEQPLDHLMANLRDLVARARIGTLRSGELSGGTVTVTNLGDQGVDSVFGVIYPPQVALIGFGRISPRPWVIDGQVVSRSLIMASLAGDHRASDGHLGGRFLAHLDTLLQRPEAL